MIGGGSAMTLKRKARRARRHPDPETTGRRRAAAEANVQRILDAGARRPFARTVAGARDRRDRRSGRASKREPPGLPLRTEQDLYLAGAEADAATCGSVPLGAALDAHDATSARSRLTRLSSDREARNTPRDYPKAIAAASPSRVMRGGAGARRRCCVDDLKQQVDSEDHVAATRWMAQGKLPRRRSGIISSS